MALWWDAPRLIVGQSALVGGGLVNCSRGGWPVSAPLRLRLPTTQFDGWGIAAACTAKGL